MKISTITKLKLIHLLMAMMFWYGIEQLFMDKVIGDPNLRAITTAIFTGTLLVLDIPGGIIADRFGRKRTIVVGSTLQFIGVLIMALSHHIALFAIGVFFYGVYWALCNGAIQAMMYDHLHEDNRHHEYAKHQGSVYAYGYLGAGIANILSGVIAHFFGLRMPYILSLIPVTLALLLAITLKRDRPTAQTERPRLRDYALVLVKTLRRSPITAVFSAQIVLGLFVFMTICEFGQVFLLSYHITAVQLGLLWAVDAGVVALGLQLAHRLQKFAWQTTAVYGCILLLFAATRQPLAIVLFMLVYAGTEIVHNISETEIQHVTASNVRATVLSSINFVGNFLALGAIWLFNRVLQVESIHRANQLTAVSIAAGLAITTFSIAVYTKCRIAKPSKI